jgi:hypothetical protein
MISPKSQQELGGELPQFASGLMTAVNEAWNNLSSLANCSSHSDMCAIAGARIAKELHKKGATTGQDAFESFKSSISRFTPSPDTLVEIPLPFEGVDHRNRNLQSFNIKFETILKKVQWSPANTTISSGSLRSSPGSTTVTSKRAAPVDVRTPPTAKRIKQ